MKAQEIISTLNLEKHPEGGYYKRTYLNDVSGEASGSAIYYLLEKGDYSHFHRIGSDEIWHHYMGGVIRLHTFNSVEDYHSMVLGTDLLLGQLPQVLILKNTWMAAEVVEGDFVLVGCTLNPAFDFDHFELAKDYDQITSDESFRSLLDRMILK